MNVNLSSLRLFTTLVLLASAAQANASASAYKFTDLGTLGGSSSEALAINNANQVAGWAFTTDGAQRATLWNGITATNLGTFFGEGGGCGECSPVGFTASRANAINDAGQVAGYSTFTDRIGDTITRASLWSGTTIIGLRDSFNSQANAINNAGQVVGTVERITGSSHAYLWNGTTRTDLGMLGGNPSSAVAINNTGQVAGWSEATGPAAPHATLWNGTTRTDLGTLGGIDSRAFAINNTGQVAGWASTTGGAHHAALWNGTRATDLGTLGGSRSEALAINSVGQVAGWASTTGGAQHAILWKGTTAIDLNGFLDASIVDAGWMLSVANGINDNGWIVGNAHNSKSGLDHAFLLAPIYTFTDLGTLGGTNSYASAINNAGQVAGWADTNAAQHATLWNGTTVTDLGTLGGDYSQAHAINEAGQVAGWANTTGNAAQHATLWNGSKTTDLGTLGGPNSRANDINDAGQATGDSRTTGDVTTHATLWNGSTATDLGYGVSIAYAINNAGEVVGESFSLYDGFHATVWNGTTAADLGRGIARAINDAGQIAGSDLGSDGPDWLRHATLWDGPTAIELGTLGGDYSEANAINEPGQVAGWANTTGNAAQHATVWNGTTATDLNSFLDASTVKAGWVLTVASDINDNGWIVGNAHNSKTGVDHAFLLAPIPEPETYTMLLAGLGLLGFIARRRRTA